MSSDEGETVHRGSYLLYPDDVSSDTMWPKDTDLAVLVLNEPIPQHNHELFSRMWERATHRICIDGGANQLYDFARSLIPHAIVGDLDSLLPHVKSYYKDRNCVVQKYDDQDSTDFMKGLAYLDSKLEHQSNNCVTVVFGGLGGRLDHTLHTLKVLFNSHKYRNVVVVSDDNLTFVVPKGKNRILVNSQVDGPACGILPLAGETVLTTSGLRWNMHEQESSFEGLMSTSNIIDSPS
ncbi:thiamine pyrophosphokinase, partial [Coemansia sp. RSA 521]